MILCGAGVAGVSSPRPDLPEAIQTVLPEAIRRVLPGFGDPLQARLACERAVELLFEAGNRAERTEAAGIVDRLGCRLADHVGQMTPSRKPDRS